MPTFNSQEQELLQSIVNRLNALNLVPNPNFLPTNINLLIAIDQGIQSLITSVNNNGGGNGGGGNGGAGNGGGNTTIKIFDGSAESWEQSPILPKEIFIIKGEIEYDWGGNILKIPEGVYINDSDQSLIFTSPADYFFLNLKPLIQHLNNSPFGNLKLILDRKSNDFYNFIIELINLNPNQNQETFLKIIGGGLSVAGDYSFIDLIGASKFQLAQEIPNALEIGTSNKTYSSYDTDREHAVVHVPLRNQKTGAEKTTDIKVVYATNDLTDVVRLTRQDQELVKVHLKLTAKADENQDILYIEKVYLAANDDYLDVQTINTFGNQVNDIFFDEDNNNGEFNISIKKELNATPEYACIAEIEITRLYSYES